MDFTEKELESLENYSIKNGVPKSRIIKKLLQEKNIIN